MPPSRFPPLGVIAGLLAVHLLALHVAIAAVPTARVRSQTPAAIALPLKQRHGVPAVNVAINREPVSLILDTGCQVSLLSAETARRVGIRPSANPTGRMILTGSHGRETARLATVDDFRAGEWKMSGLPMVVRDRPSDRALHNPLSPRVLIDVLSGQVLRGVCSHVTLDEAANRATFGFEGKFSPARRDATSAAFRIEAGLPYADVQVNGVRIRCLIDTGTTAALELSPADIAATGLRTTLSAHTRKRIGIGQSGGEASRIRSGRVAHIAFGGVHLLNAEALSVGDRSKIGYGFMKNFRTTFDFRRSRIWFETR